MRRFGSSVLGAIVSLFLVRCAATHEPIESLDQPHDPRVESLIQGLEADSFREREQATDRLFQRGLDVLPRVLQQIQTGKGESSERSLQVLRRFLNNTSTHDRARQMLDNWLETTRDAVRMRVESRLFDDQLRYAQRLINRGASIGVNNRQVVDVDCDGCEITDNDLRVLRYFRKLRRLSVGGTQIGDAGMAHLRGLNEIRIINLYRSQVGDEGLRIISRLPKLHHLAAGETNITDAGLTHLANKTQMTYVGMRGNRITDDGVAKIKNLTNLTGIYLGETQITDRAVEYLTNMKQLYYVRIHETKITDRGLDLLGRLPNLKMLLIYDTEVTAAGLKRLRQNFRS